MLVCAFGVQPATASRHAPTPGAADSGDALFPGLGNGGYDVKHYTLRLSYGSTASVQLVPAVVTIRARATQALSRFDLDFSGDSVASVEVNGRAAAFVRQGEELVVAPARPIRNHRRFVVSVAYTSGPRAISPRTRPTSTRSWRRPGSRRRPVL